MHTAPKRCYRYGLSTPLWLCLLALIALICSVSVYVIPTFSGQSIEGSYDAFGYIAILAEDSAFAREQQPFLTAYPNFLPRSILPLYAILLHATLLLPALKSIYKTHGKSVFIATVASLAAPESAIFLGSVSKEGLGIVAVVAVLAGQGLLLKNHRWQGWIMCVYAISIAEFSRPFFGFPFGLALTAGLIPALKPRTRRLLLVAFLAAIAIGVWVILLGPLASEFTEKYQAAKQFLDWFEEEMGSTSPIKAAAREFFALAFQEDEPSIRLLLLIVLAAIGKAIVYVLAIPLVAPAVFANMPAQAWAITWQVAASMSSIVMVAGLLALRRCPITVDDRCRLWFAATLMLMISISTAIFHVRYRAPAVVAILAATWIVIPRHRKWLPWMITPSVLAAWAAITATA